MATGYEKIYAALLPKLAGCDLAQNGPRLGGALVRDAVIMPFLGRRYLITSGGVEPEDGGLADVNSKSVLAYYVTSSGAGDFLYDFAPLNRLSGMIDGQNSLAGGIMNGPLIRELADNYSGFERAMRRLGGVEIPEPSSGKHVWQLRPLPKILCQMVFYDADDEFPAEIQIMFDKSAPRFLDFECLAFMTGAMVKAIIKAGGKAPADGSVSTKTV